MDATRRILFLQPEKSRGLKVSFERVSTCVVGTSSWRLCYDFRF
jgi:hypothetical protein